MHLSPILIRIALRDGNMRRLRRMHPEDCMECGCCSYICPANIPLVDVVRSARSVLKHEEVSK